MLAGVAVSAQAQESGTFAYTEVGVGVFAGSETNGSEDLSGRNASVAAVVSSPAKSPLGDDITASAGSYVDLASGKMGNIFASSLFGYSRAFAGWQETLHVTVAGATETTLTPIEFNFTFHGTFGKNSTGASNSMMVFAQQPKANGDYHQTSFFDGRIASFRINRSSAGGLAEDEPGYVPDHFLDSGWLSYEASVDASGDLYTVKAVYGFLGAESPLRLNASIFGGSSHEGNGDFSNTAAVTMRLPDTVTYTSASGVFLTQVDNVSAVPEPMTWMLMVSGFGAAGYRLRRTTVARPA
jgi:hypothetical protein